MSSTDELDDRYRIEFSVDEPGVLENVLTGGAASIVDKALEKTLGGGHGWCCKITDSVTDLWESRCGVTKSEAQEAAFRALKRKVDGFIEKQEKEEARQRGAYEQRQYESRQPEHHSSADDSSGEGCIVKLIIAGIAIVAIMWFVFALAIPLLVIDVAAIALIAGLVRKEMSKFLLPLSVAGTVLVLADYNQGWFTKALATNVPFLAGMVPVLLYINVLAGLIAAYLLIRTFMDKRNPPLENAGEFTKRNLIAMGCLLLVGALMVGLQLTVDSQRRQALQSPAAPNPTSSSGNATTAGQPGTALKQQRQSKQLNADSLRMLSAEINRKIVGKWWSEDHEEFIEFAANGSCTEGNKNYDGTWDTNQSSLSVYSDQSFTCREGTLKLVGPNTLTCERGRAGDKDKYYRGLNGPKPAPTLTLALAQQILNRDVAGWSPSPRLNSCMACWDPNDKGENDNAPIGSTYSDALTQFLVRQGYIRSSGGQLFFTAKAKQSKYYGAGFGPELRFAYFRNPRILATTIADHTHVPIEYEFVPTELTMPFFHGPHKVNAVVSFVYVNEEWHAQLLK